MTHLDSGFASALQAATRAAGGQSYPAGCLYLVATPIGNLADISLRALHVLQLVDLLACEDTRHTQALLRGWGMQRPASHMLALHQHNEREAAQTVAQRLQQGQRIAYVSDAGTPAISDPGAHLVQAVQAAGLRVMPIPGASSIVTALSASGADTAEQGNGVAGSTGGWVFAGFLPAKGREREQSLTALLAEPRTVVLLEAPHRIATLCAALAAFGNRQVTLARELTKQFESIHTLPAQDVPAWIAAAPENSKGEFVVVLHALPQVLAADADMLTAHEEKVLRLLLAELPLKTAVKLATDMTGAPRNRLYEWALQLKQPSAKPG